MLSAFASKIIVMMSREEILSVEQYCSEHNVTYKQRLAELSIPFWKFYRAKLDRDSRKLLKTL